MKAIIINGKTINPYKNGLSDVTILRTYMGKYGDAALYLIQYSNWRGRKINELINLFDGAKSSFEKGNELEKYYKYRALLVENVNLAYTEDVFDIIRTLTLCAILRSWKTWFLK